MKIIQLIAPEDDETLGLKKDDPYFVVTHASGVEGLEDTIKKLLPKIPIIEVATEQENGLLSKNDKKKNNDLPTGFVLSVNQQTGDILLTAESVGALGKTEKATRATTADKLATARKINGIAFDGTTDIVLPGPNLSTIEKRLAALESLMPNILLIGGRKKV